jgi:hypothetical protein
MSGGKSLAVEQRLGIGHARQQCADGVAIAAQCRAMVSEDVRDVKTIGVIKNSGE